MIDDFGEKHYHGGFYNIWFEGLDEPVACYKSRVDLAKFEDEMLQEGISEEIIEKHKELVIAHVQDEQALDGECL